MNRAFSACDGLGTAERLEHTLVRPWWDGQRRGFGLLVPWSLQHADERMKGLEVLVTDRLANRLFDAMVSRDERRVRSAHRARTLLGRDVLASEPSAPRLCPVVEGTGIAEHRRKLPVRGGIGG